MSADIFIYHSVSYDAAKRLLDALLLKARQDGGKPVAVAVVDDRGDLLAFGRLDGTPIRSVAIAINKGYTASRTRQSTSQLASGLLKAGRGADVYTDPRISLFPGGVPLTTSSGTVVGAVGVSGRLPDEDEGLAGQWRDYIDLQED